MTNSAPAGSRTKGVIRALVVYLGVSWLVMQFIDTLSSLLSLPAWLGTATVVVLALGLPIVLATAWVQSLATTTAAEEAGEVPTDWQVAPVDAVTELMAGHIPHLTWGRAIAAGVITLSLTIGAAGGYVLVNGSEGLRAPRVAEGIGRAVAVLPFSVSGEGDLGHLEEGMVVLLSENLDGVGDLRAVNHRTVMARWDEERGTRDRLDLPAQLRVATNAGARFALSGSVVSLGETARFTVDIHDLAGDGEELARAEGVGSPDDIFELVDGLSVDIVRVLLGAEEAQNAEALSLASITTHSVTALNAYLRGVTAFRESRMNEAAALFDQAVATDSTFALAWVRLAEVIAWAGESAHSPEAAAAGVAAYADQLAPREQIIAEARRLFNSGDRQIETVLRTHLRRYPDDGQAWFMLGDAYLHWLVPTPADSILVAFRRAVEFDPGHTPHWGHLFEMELGAGNVEEARAARDVVLSQADPDSEIARDVQTAYTVFFGPDDERAEMYAAARETGGLPRLFVMTGIDDFSHQLEFARFAAANGFERSVDVVQTLQEAGRPQEMLAATDGQYTPFLQATLETANLVSMEDAFDADLGAHDLLNSLEECDPELICSSLRWLSISKHGSVVGHPDEVLEADTALRQILSSLKGPSGDPAGVSLIRVIEEFLRTEDPEMNDQARLDELLARSDSVGPMVLNEFWEGDPVTRALPIGRAAIAVGDLELAEPYLRYASWRSGFRASATYHLARMLDDQGRSEEALVEYRRLAVMWAEAEEGFTPRMKFGRRLRGSADDADRVGLFSASVPFFPGAVRAMKRIGRP